VGRPRRRRRGFNPRPITPGAAVTTNGTPAPAPDAAPADSGTAPPRKFRRRRGRRRSSFSRATATPDGETSPDGGAPPPPGASQAVEREPAAQAIERGS